MQIWASLLYLGDRTNTKLRCVLNLEGGGHRDQEERYKDKQVKIIWKPRGGTVSKNEWPVVRYHRNCMYNTELCSVDLGSWQLMVIFRRIILTE